MGDPIRKKRNLLQLWGQIQEIVILHRETYSKITKKDKFCRGVNVGIVTKISFTMDALIFIVVFKILFDVYLMKNCRQCSQI